MYTRQKITKNFMQLAIIVAVASMGVNCKSDSSPSSKAGASKAAATSSFELNGTAEAGKDLYVQHCAACHGDDGKGDGPGGRALTPKPTDFTAQKQDAERAYTAIKDGGMAVGKSAIMPPFKSSLDDQQIRDVTAYVLSLHH